MKTKPNKIFSVLILLCISAALGFVGYRFVNQYWQTRKWRKTSAKIWYLKIKYVKKESEGKTKFVKECEVLYEYSVRNKTYEGNRASVHSKYGPETLCTVDLLGKNSTMCFYDPQKPTISALDIKTPVVVTAVMIIGSWAILLIASCSLHVVFKLVPVIYGVASAGILLKIAVESLPIVDGWLIGGIILVILAVLGPCIDFCCSKLPKPQPIAQNSD